MKRESKLIFIFANYPDILGRKAVGNTVIIFNVTITLVIYSDFIKVIAIKQKRKERPE